MEGLSASASGLMLSRWGMEALGSISDLNAMPLQLHTEFPMIPHEAEDAFLYTAEHLTEVWLILLVFVAVPLVIGDLCLHNVKNDTRG